jgi:hypothetical protein
LRRKNGTFKIWLQGLRQRKNPPWPPFNEGGKLKSPFSKGGFRGILKWRIYGNLNGKLETGNPKPRGVEDGKL